MLHALKCNIVSQCNIVQQREKIAKIFFKEKKKKLLTNFKSHLHTKITASPWETVMNNNPKLKDGSIRTWTLLEPENMHTFAFTRCLHWLFYWARIMCTNIFFFVRIYTNDLMINDQVVYKYEINKNSSGIDKKILTFRKSQSISNEIYIHFKINTSIGRMIFFSSRCCNCFYCKFRFFGC